MTKRMIIMIGAVLVLAAGLAFGFYLHVQQLIASAPKPTPVTVSTAKAEQQQWQRQIVAVGDLSAVNGVDLSMEVPGIVSNIPIHSGDAVEAGAVILQLNTDPDEAALASLVAEAELSAKTLARDQDLLAKQVAPQSTVDSDVADLNSKNALVAQQKALIAQKTLKAPFAGDIGIVSANLGQYLTAGEVVVTLQDLRSLYVDFLVPQDQVGLLALGQAVTVDIAAYPDKKFTGSVAVINPKIDPDIRNVKVRATVANPEKLLRPGMFVRATVDIGEPYQQLTLPQTAITFNSYGATVFIVEEAKAEDAKTGGSDAKAGSASADESAASGLEAQQVFVTTGETRGDQVAIVKGVDAGQEVVTSGQLKLKSGTPIVVNNSVQLPDDPSPKPQEN